MGGAAVLGGGRRLGGMDGLHPADGGELGQGQSRSRSGYARCDSSAEAHRAEPEAGFEPISFEECVEDDVLLLDDPLSDIESDAAGGEAIRPG